MLAADPSEIAGVLSPDDAFLGAHPFETQIDKLHEFKEKYKEAAQAFGISTDVINETRTNRGFNGEIITLVSDKVNIFLKPPGLPNYRLTNVSPLLSSANLSLSGYASGDSGGPLFIPYNDELILLGIIQTRGGSGGTAKNFGNAQIQELISEGMEAVGNTWGYQLSTVRLS